MGRGGAAKRQPSVKTDDSAAEVRLEYLLSFQGRLQRRTARTATSWAKMTTELVKPSDHRELPLGPKCLGENWI